MGLLWLSTVPLTNGIVANMFGIKYLTMLSGIVFFTHQVGSFFGGWLGGLNHDLTGNYNAIWIVSIALSAFARTWCISGSMRSTSFMTNSLFNFKVLLALAVIALLVFSICFMDANASTV